MSKFIYTYTYANIYTYTYRHIDIYIEIWNTYLYSVEISVLNNNLKYTYQDFIL